MLYESCWGSWWGAVNYSSKEKGFWLLLEGQRLLIDLASTSNHLDCKPSTHFKSWRWGLTKDKMQKSGFFWEANSMVLQLLSTESASQLTVQYSVLPKWNIGNLSQNAAGRSSAAKHNSLSYNLQGIKTSHIFKICQNTNYISYIAHFQLEMGTIASNWWVKISK